MTLPGLGTEWGQDWGLGGDCFLMVAGKRLTRRGRGGAEEAAEGTFEGVHGRDSQPNIRFYNQ
jgi:hypothetical protein